MMKKTTAWLEFADRDLEAAKKLVNYEYLANIVIFHSQQCVEKCLKAILEEHNQYLPKIHGVTKLYELVRKNTNISLPISDDELDLVDNVYIDARYPGNFGLLPSGFPTKDDAASLFSIAKNVYQSTINELKQT